MKPIIITTALACLSAHPLFAGAIQQVDSTQQRSAHPTVWKDGDSIPSIYAGEESDVGPQYVLRSKERRSYIEATADAQFFHTDNLFLSDDDKIATDVLVSTAQITLAPTAYDLADGKFAPRLGYRHQWFNFGLINSDKISVFDLSKLGTGNPNRNVRLSEFDFNVQTVFTDLTWSRDNWIAQVGFDFTRLLSTPGYNQFYEEYVPRWGLQRLFPVNEKTSFSIGYAGDYRFTSADTLPPVVMNDYNDRTDHSLFATWTQALCENAFLQPYYRFTYTHFTESNDRKDCLHSVGLGLYYYFTPQISARVFAAYDVRRSNNAADYEKFDKGGGLNLTFRF